MTKEQIKNLAISHMSRHLSSEWTFAWTNRKRAHGLCNYRTKQILLNVGLEHAIKESDILDIILHEIAHAMTQGAKHGYLWRVACHQLGAIPRSTKNIPEVQSIANATSKYISNACGCGKVYHAHRVPKGRSYYCKVCKQPVVYKLNTPARNFPRIAALEPERNTVTTNPLPVEPPKPAPVQPMHDANWHRERRESEERLRKLYNEI